MCCLNSIEFDDFGANPSLLGLEEGDSSDEDFVPSLHLRYVSIFIYEFWVEVELHLSVAKRSVFLSKL